MGVLETRGVAYEGVVIVDFNKSSHHLTQL